MGIIALLLLILVLIAVRFTLQLWVKPEEVELTHVELPVKHKVQDLNKQYYQPSGEKINLNTADSLTLITLPGIGKGLSHRILERRRQLGRFSNMQQVFEAYKFKQQTKDMLLQRTVIE